MGRKGEYFGQKKSSRMAWEPYTLDAAKKFAFFFSRQKLPGLEAREEIRPLPFSPAPSERFASPARRPASTKKDD
jgi:hypothetical protein